MGSWKIMLILLPRMFRNSSFGVSRRFWPRNRISPSTVAARRSTKPRTVRNVTLLPDPDSPTTPRVSPWSTEKEIPSTALTSPSSVGKWTRRSLTWRRGSANLRVPYSRIQERVDHVNDQIGHHDEERRHDGDAHDDGEILGPDALDRVFPDPIEVEHGLRDDGPTEQVPQIHAEHGDHGGQGGPKPVLEDDPPLRQPLGSGGPDVVLGEGLDQVPADHPGVERREQERQGDPRQDELPGEDGVAHGLPGIEARAGGPLQGGPEDEQHDVAKPEDRRRHPEQREQHGPPVGQGSSADRRDDPDGDTDDQPDDSGA